MTRRNQKCVEDLGGSARPSRQDQRRSQLCDLAKVLFRQPSISKQQPLPIAGFHAKQGLPGVVTYTIANKFIKTRDVVPST